MSRKTFNPVLTNRNIYIRPESLAYKEYRLKFDYEQIVKMCQHLSEDSIRSQSIEYAKSTFPSADIHKRNEEIHIHESSLIEFREMMLLNYFSYMFFQFDKNIRLLLIDVFRDSPKLEPLIDVLSQCSLKCYFSLLDSCGFKPSINKKIDQYQNLVNIFKHGYGRSYDSMMGSTVREDFIDKTKSIQVDHHNIFKINENNLLELYDDIMDVYKNFPTPIIFPPKSQVPHCFKKCFKGDGFDIFFIN